MCLDSLTEDEKKQKKTHDRIKREIRRAKKKKEFEFKLLILGAGESGKSKIF